MGLPPYHKEWFKLSHPNIKILDGKEKLIVQTFNVFQGSADVGKKWNDLFNKVLEKLDITRSSSVLAMCVCRINGAIVILNVSTDDALACTDSPIMRTKIINHLKHFFPITANEGSILSRLNYRITQSSSHVTLDQSDRMSKMTTKYFRKDPYAKKDIPFRADREVEKI